MDKRRDVLKAAFIDHLVRWGLGNATDLEAVVETLLKNVNLERGWGEPGRTTVAGTLTEAHKQTLLEYFDIPDDQAFALGRALVLWEILVVAQEQNPNLQMPSPIEATGVTARRRRRILLISDEWLPFHGGMSRLNASLAKALAVRHNVAVYLANASDSDVERAKADNVEIFRPDSEDVLGFEAQMISGVTSELLAFRPDTLIGHDRRTGPIALALKSRPT